MRLMLTALTGAAALFSLPACAEKPVTSAGAGSVWVVESATTKLYLCGTIHLLRSQDFPLPTAYETAYADSQKLVFELPPGVAHDPQLAVKMRTAGTYEGNDTLSAKVGRETWSALGQWAKSHGLSVSAFDKFRPWFAALTISATEYALLGADPDRGVDQIFETRSRKDGKAGEGLETLEFQLGLFTSLSEAHQQELLEQTLAEVKTLPTQFEKMISSWRVGDADALHEMLFEEAEKYPELLDAFLTQRNARWINQLEGYLATKEHVMVLVGTGHLGGKGGVIDLLKARGYKVTKLAEGAATVAR